MERNKTIFEKGTIIASGVILAMGAVAASAAVAVHPPAPVGFIPERRPLTHADPTVNGQKLRFPKNHGSFRPQR